MTSRDKIVSKNNASLTNGVTIIVPSYNHAHLLTHCLEKLANQKTSVPHEIIVVDDGSTDSTRKVVQNAQKTMKNLVYLHKTNGGCGSARNLGVKKAKYDIIGFTDDDCEVTPQWLDEAYRAMIKNKLDVLEGRTITNVLEFTPLSHAAVNEGVGNILGCNFFARKEVLLDIPFDERFRNAFREDSDFVFRMFEKKYKWDYVPAALIVHPPLHMQAWPYIRRLIRLKKPYWNAMLYKKHPAQYRKAFYVKGMVSKDFFLVGPIYASFALAIWGIYMGGASAVIGLLNLMIVYLLCGILTNLDLTQMTIKRYSRYAKELMLFLALYWIVIITNEYWRIRGLLRFGVLVF